METQSTKALVHGAIEDVKKLVQLEARLLKHEAIQFGTKSRRALGFGIGALALIIPAITMLAIAMASGLQTLLAYPQWLCFALVGLVGIATSALCVGIAQRIVENSIKELLHGSENQTRTRDRENHPVLARQD